MSETDSRDPEVAQRIAEPVRRAIQSLLKQRVSASENVGAEFKRIAEVLRKKPKTIQSLIYEGKGGFDLMIAALIVSYDLDKNYIDEFFKDLKIYLKKISPSSLADKNWQALDSILSDREKLHWTEVMKAVSKIELTLQSKTKP